jgi:hypothetical protein
MPGAHPASLGAGKLAAPLLDFDTIRDAHDRKGRWILIKPEMRAIREPHFFVVVVVVVASSCCLVRSNTPSTTLFSYNRTFWVRVSDYGMDDCFSL